MQKEQREHIIKIWIVTLNNFSKLFGYNLFSSSTHWSIFFCQASRSKPIANRFYHFTTDAECFHSIIFRKERFIFSNTTHAFPKPALAYIERLVAFQFYLIKFFLFIYHQSIPFL